MPSLDHLCTGIDDPGDQLCKHNWSYQTICDSINGPPGPYTYARTICALDALLGLYTHVSIKMSITNSQLTVGNLVQMATFTFTYIKKITTHRSTVDPWLLGPRLSGTSIIRNWK